MKVKILYAETYKPHVMKVRDHVLPTVPSAAPGFVVDSAYLMKAGRADVGGRELEFQDLRVYFREEST